MPRPEANAADSDKARDLSRWLYALWIALAVVMAVRTVASPVKHTVFPIFAASSANWWHDRPLYGYDPARDLFRYSPTFAVLLSPFASLGLTVGGILWSWSSLALFAVGLCRFAKDVLPEKLSGPRLAGFFTIAVFIAMPGIWNSQSNTLVVGLILLASSSLSRERWWATSMLVAVAVWMKLTPLAPALLFCGLRPARLSPRFAVALAVGALVPFLTRPPAIVWSHYVDWFASLTESGSNRWPGFRDGWTLWLSLSEFCRQQNRPYWLIMPIDSVWYRAMQGVSALGLLAWCLCNRKNESTKRLITITLGLGMAWMMLFGPAVEHATYVFLAPLLAWSIVSKETGWGGRGVVLLSFVLIAVLGWDPLTGSILKGFPLMAAALPLGAVLFALWQIRYAFQGRPNANLTGASPTPVLASETRTRVGGVCGLLVGPAPS